MAEFGLKQGEHELEIYAMCELPANVIYADEFLRVFDGYSIGSNDLTQLTLGLDRDSEMVAHLFDERDGAVERMVTLAIEAAHRAGKKIGICGQAPSDYPEFAQFLVEKGISSISLNPDTVLQTTHMILEAEGQTRDKPAGSSLGSRPRSLDLSESVVSNRPSVKRVCSVRYARERCDRSDCKFRRSGVASLDTSPRDRPACASSTAFGATCRLLTRFECPFLTPWRNLYGHPV